MVYSSRLICGNPIRVYFVLIERRYYVYFIDLQVFDLGQNTAGWCRLSIRAFKGPSGFSTHIRYGEVLVQSVVTAK